jgi:hypothetical protein
MLLPEEKEDVFQAFDRIKIVSIRTISASSLEMLIGYWWENRRERNHWEDQDVGGWIILRWIL